MYLLLIFLVELSGGAKPPVTVIEFSSKVACQAAIDAAELKSNINAKAVCVKK